MNQIGKFLGFFTLVLLCSCSGGGGSNSIVVANSSFSGVALDGYLYQALVFLDLNGNGQYDSGEPSDTTDKNGKFTFNATYNQVSSHPLIGKTIAGSTTDSDNPSTFISQSMTLFAVQGVPNVISPLTTLVTAKIATGLTASDAKVLVQTELGLNDSEVLTDFIATSGNGSTAHKIAAAVSVVLANVESESSVNTTLANKLASIVSGVTSFVTPNVSSIKSAISIDEAKIIVSNAILNSKRIYSVGGSISGLRASGLVLSNGSATLSLASGATSFSFSAKKSTGETYSVAIQSNPTGQTCNLSNSVGTVGSQSISDISILCSDSTGVLSGTVSGLTSSGLILKNGTDEVAVGSGQSTFQFGSQISNGVIYSVTIKNQPIGKTCSIGNSSGAMSPAGVNNIQVTCAINSYTLGGAVSGLITSGLKLRNGSEVLTVSSSETTFTLNTPIAYGGSYAVTVDAQPVGYTCSVSNASGTMGSGNVTSVQVTCATNSYALGGLVTGVLTSTGLKIRNGSEIVDIAPFDSSFSFTTQIAYGGSYAVTIETQPNGSEVCTLSHETGIVESMVNNVTLTCSVVHGVVTTLAGSTTSGNADGTGTNATFQFPTGIAVDQNGNIYVADATDFYSTVRKITPAGVVSTLAGSTTGGSNDGTGSAASFTRLMGGIAVDTAGNVYVADLVTNLIRKITADGVVTTLAGTLSPGDADGVGTAASFLEPTSVAIDSNNNLYVADRGNNKIRKITPAGIVTTFAGSGALASIDGTGIAASFSSPKAIAVDSNDNLLVADSNGDSLIRKITPSGVVTTLAGGAWSRWLSGTNGSCLDARFYGPSAFATDASGNIYVADSGNSLIRKISPSCVVSTLAGTYNSNWFADGAGTAAAFDFPMGVAVDSNGNVYVADTGNHMIRRISP